VLGCQLEDDGSRTKPVAITCRRVFVEVTSLCGRDGICTGSSGGVVGNTRTSLWYRSSPGTQRKHALGSGLHVTAVEARTGGLPANFVISRLCACPSRGVVVVCRRRVCSAVPLTIAIV